MSIPSNDDFLSAGCTWFGSHNGIRYKLSWHGRSDYNPKGTWCYYLLVNQEQFYPDDWAKLRLERQDHQFMGAGSWHRHWSYENFPDVDFHGGPTWGEMTVYLGRDGKEYELVTVGCDYAHLWDEECGRWQGKNEIEDDAKRSIDLLCKQFPRRRAKCSYTGQYDDADKFYTAVNGALVHESQREELATDKYWCEVKP